MRFRSIAAMSAALFAYSAAASFAVPSPQSITTGTYHPGNGSPDTPWQITTSNTLVWGTHAFVPVGVVFRPASLTADQASSDAAWQSDQAGLDLLKQHGVYQILVDVTAANNGATPLVSIRPESLQRLINYLDQNGFQYGLDLNAFPPSGLAGVSIDPALYRQPAPTQSAVSEIKGIDGLVGARYWLVSTRDASVLTYGTAKINGHNADVKVSDAGGENTVLLLYPTRLLTSDTLEGRHCPDIWSNTDRSRDDLLLYLGKITFGTGLRFFLDPVRDNFGLYGTLAKGFIPDSPAYIRGYKTWLSAHYSDRISVLQRSWALTDIDLPDFDTAARCIPLWNGLKGVQSLYDPVGDKLYNVNAGDSKFWNDCHKFQNTSVVDTMNAFAESIKHGIANVPVVYRWGAQVSALPASNSKGYDGLMLTSGAHGDSLIPASADTVSAVDRGARSLWMLATQSVASTIGKNLLQSDADTLTGIGNRGLFEDLGSNPDSSQLDSLMAVKSTSADLDLEAASLGSGAANNLYYPANLGLEDAYPKKLGANSWWLPAVMDSDPVYLGPEIEGYTTTGAPGKEYVVYSKTHTPVEIKMNFSGLEHPLQMFPDGSYKSVPTKHNTADLIIGPNPVILTGFGTMPIPNGAISAESAEVTRLIKIGTDSHAPMDTWASKLSYITDNPIIAGPDGSPTQFAMLTELASEIKSVVSPYNWIEAESPSIQASAFSLEASDTSNGAYLWLDGNQNGADSPSATYPFVCRIPGDYDIWAAIGPIDSDGVYEGSSISVVFDDSTPLSSQDARPTGTTYGTLASIDEHINGSFVWERLTTVHLTAGQHSMLVTISGASKATGRVSAAIDCFCLDRNTFTPSGILKPNF